METKLIEASQHARHGFNWGKFCVARFDDEWRRDARIDCDGPRPRLLRSCGWGPEHLWVLDLQTGEGAFFRAGGSAHADLEKHAIWVCPMHEPFLEWLYVQDLTDISALPDLVELPDAAPAFAGYRRPGPQAPPG